MKHYSVMLKETIDSLSIKEDGIYVDGTLGRGGHSLEILKKLKNGHLYSFDLDTTAIEESKVRLKEYEDKITYIHDNFKNFDQYIEKVDGILLDLGVSSPQFDDEERGFSYRFDSKLDMRMNKDDKFSAYDVVNSYSKEELTKILRDYGEEKFAYQIANKIEKNRQDKPIETTFELVEIVKSALPSKELNKKGHPAKQTFQAIRIEVNHELDSLKEFLSKIEQHLNIGGICSIITFHSLEDRLVKVKFKELSTDKDDKNLILKQSEIEKADFELVTRKPIVANDLELDENSRSKSAKLRSIRKVK